MSKEEKVARIVEVAAQVREKRTSGDVEVLAREFDRAAAVAPALTHDKEALLVLGGMASRLEEWLIAEHGAQVDLTKTVTIKDPVFGFEIKLPHVTTTTRDAELQNWGKTLRPTVNRWSFVPLAMVGPDEDWWGAKSRETRDKMITGITGSLKDFYATPTPTPIPTATPENEDKEHGGGGPPIDHKSIFDVPKGIGEGDGPLPAHIAGSIDYMLRYFVIMDPVARRGLIAASDELIRSYGK